MRPPRSSGSPLRIEALAGWVFADLLLVLFIVGLGTQLTMTPKPVELAKPKVVKPKVEEQLGMELKPHYVDLDVDADRLLAGSNKEERRLRTQIRDKTADLKGKKSGMTLIWGCAGSVNRGQPLARATGRQLEKARPALFSDGAKKPLWDGKCAEGRIQLEIYLFNTPASPAES